MAVFQVELKKIVDDSYEIEIGFGLADRLLDDLDAGLVGGGIRKIAVVTDETVASLYAGPLCSLLNAHGYAAELFSFPAGEESKTR